MRESQGVDKLRERLVSHYGDKRVVAEPRIEQSVRPDFLIYEEDGETPFMVVEYRSSISYGRGDETLERLFSLFAKIGCEYGALVTPSVEYVYRNSPFSTTLEQSLGGFPEEPNDLPDPRPIRSKEETRFLLDRCIDISSDPLDDYDDAEIVKAVLQALLYKIVLRNDRLSDVEPDRFSEIIERGTERLREQFDAYQPPEITDWEHITGTTLSVFQGYDLEETPPEVISELIEFESQGGVGVAEHKTSSKLVTPVLSLAEISEGQSVLDPAAGWGRLARSAVREGAEVSAVEIDQAVVNIGLLISELTETSVDYVCADFLEIAQNPDTDSQISLAEYIEEESSEIDEPYVRTWLNERAPFDRVILDPPAGDRLPSTKASFSGEGREKIRIEEAFLSNALELLVEDGVLVAILPEYILSGTRAQEFRRMLLESVTIEAIATFESDIFSGAKAKGALLKLRNSPPTDPQQIDVAEVDTREVADIEEALESEVADLLSGEAESVSVSSNTIRTLLPKQILGEQAVLSELQERYQRVTTLDEVAEDIMKGIARPEDRADADEENTVRYLRPSDAVEESDRTPEYVPEDAARVVAGPTDVLILTKGEESAVYRPERPVVPSSDWAILRFSSEALATEYAEYFESDLAIQSLESNSRGTIVQYIPVSALRELAVPNLRAGGDLGGG